MEHINPLFEYPISNTQFPMSKFKAEQPVNPEIQYPCWMLAIRFSR